MCVCMCEVNVWACVCVKARGEPQVSSVPFETVSFAGLEVTG
jgi:putative heme iron utilization protein